MKITNKMLRYERNLKKYASYNKQAIRLKEEPKELRGEYFKDTDRIIYSKSYLRYMDKTQVFIGIKNDHISRRMSHVQMVSKIARTIGRALSLNEDLIEAIALGHDLGHTPFGHIGETLLNEISLKNNQGIFMHNVESVRNLMNLENNGNGLNLTIQVLDGILCHNGELILEKYTSVKKNKEQFLKEYEKCYESKEFILSLRPMTLEGCIVRISDVISYLGKDIEDAIMLGLLEKKSIPSSITKVLGNTNSTIISTIVTDIIKNSQNKPYITMSQSVNKAIEELKKFNYEHIYNKSMTEDEKKHYQLMFELVFEKNLENLKQKNQKSLIYTKYLKEMNEEYQKNTPLERIVIDYIAGMTDDYFMEEYSNIIAKKNN